MFNKGIKDVHGTDISNWAVEYGKQVFPDLSRNIHYYTRDMLTERKDHVMILDVLEHMPDY